MQGRALVARLLLIALAGCAPPQEARSSHPPFIDSTQTMQESPKGFVDAFYRWYAPIAGGKTSGPAWYVTFNQRRALLTPELHALLIQDSIAQAEKWMAEHKVPVVIEVILERVTNIAMGTEIDNVVEFEELAADKADVPTAVAMLD